MAESTTAETSQDLTDAQEAFAWEFALECGRLSLMLNLPPDAEHLPNYKLVLHSIAAHRVSLAHPEHAEVAKTFIINLMR